MRALSDMMKDVEAAGIMLRLADDYDLLGQEAFAVIRDAMSRACVIGLARVVLSSRERPFLVESMGSGLRGVTLRFAGVRSETDYFSDIP